MAFSTGIIEWNGVNARWRSQTLPQTAQLLGVYTRFEVLVEIYDHKER